MIDELKSVEELELKKKEVKPKIDELKAKKEEEIQKINKKYDQLISEINSDIEKFEEEVNKELINSFINIVMEEFDAKRSTSEYAVTNKFKEYNNLIATVNIFPKELIEKLEKVINGEPIENIAYDIENIKSKYLKS